MQHNKIVLKINFYMRKFTILVCALVLGSIHTRAQYVAHFESLSLPGYDTFYVNYSNPGTDVGFVDGMVHFPCVYDTGFGYKFLSQGFVYSNKTDSFTSGFQNQFSTKAGTGFDGSLTYLVAFGAYNKLKLTPAAQGKYVYGFYVTNSTFAYNTMRDGDAFSKKFGGVNGTDSDWFKITIRGYYNGVYTPDSVEVYLADFRSPQKSKDSILKHWKWVNLLPLGIVDSVDFTLSSSDVGQFGMNTPTYFCMDNLMIKNFVSVNDAPGASVAKVYPNPAVNQLFVETNDEKIRQINVMDMTGKLIATYEVKDRLTSVNTSSYPVGSYILQLVGENQNATVRFVKQ
jgi:hypothetical protein